MNTNTIKNEILHIRVNQTTRQEAEQIFEQIGLTSAQAVNIFLTKVVNTNGIPFDLKAPEFNKETLSALQEAKDIISGKIKPNHKSIDELFDEAKRETNA
ncbi:MAG: type II toxin-antitoxin system RelB/DinJ family antitoxin [Clostridiales bacterium]|jgi:DNA-damage-inducible protein J|nr:type II toxin-antitoxin system RelB/DinJ family antitoxin [Clostridiales bacterium]